MSQPAYETEHIETNDGPLQITLIGHGTLQLEWNGRVVQVDPWSKLANYEQLPKADVVLITHEHVDHLDKTAIAATSTSATRLLSNQSVISILGEGMALQNGDLMDAYGILVEAVPAYNYTEGRRMFHPKGRDNGYILRFGDKRIYIAGDTEDIPELEAIHDIELAFLPVNQPYTMTPAQFSHAVSLIKPRIVIPYHSGQTDMDEVQRAFDPSMGTELRIRKMH